MADLGHSVPCQLPGQGVDVRVEEVSVIEITESNQLPVGGREGGREGRRGSGREGWREGGWGRGR